MVRQYLNRRIADIDTVTAGGRLSRLIAINSCAYIVGCGAATAFVLLAVCRFRLAGVERCCCAIRSAAALSAAAPALSSVISAVDAAVWRVECAWHPVCPAIAKR